MSPVLQGLRLVLSKSHLQGGTEEEMEVEDSEAARVIPTHKWLLDQLPRVPHFAAINPAVCATLRQVCDQSQPCLQARPYTTVHISYLAQNTTVIVYILSIFRDQSHPRAHLPACTWFYKLAHILQYTSAI